MADAIGFLQMRSLLAYSGTLEQRSAASTAERIDQIRWENSRSLYTRGFTIDELRQVEWLLPRMRMELDVEGILRTTPWYQLDLVSKVQSENLSESVDALLQVGHFLQNWSDRLVKARRIWQSASVLVRYLEYMSKLEARHLQFFKTHAESLIATRHLTDLPWPEIKPESWLETMKGLREKLTHAVAAHVGLLVASPKPEDLPDYLGQFIHATGENLFDYLMNRNAKAAEALIRPYLVGTLVLFNNMKPSSPKVDIWTEQKLQIAAAPVLDLLEISGYACCIQSFTPTNHCGRPCQEFGTNSSREVLGPCRGSRLSLREGPLVFNCLIAAS